MTRKFPKPTPEEQVAVDKLLELANYCNVHEIDPEMVAQHAQRQAAKETQHKSSMQPPAVKLGPGGEYVREWPGHR